MISTNAKVWRILLAIFVIITIVFALCFYFKDIFLTIVIGMTLIIFTEKLMEIFTKRADRNKWQPWKRKVYAYAFILFWIFSLYVLFSNSFEQVTEAIATGRNDAALATVYAQYIKPVVPEIISERILTEDSLRTVESYVFGLFSSFVSGLSFLVLNGILIIPLMFYMYFRKSHVMITKLKEIIPKKFKKGFVKATSEISSQLHDFLDAKVKESIIIGTICCLGFYVAGVQGWLLLGFLAGFLNIVPYLGPVIGSIPPLLISLLGDPIVAVYVLITVLVAQIIDNLYIIPFMISSKVKVDSLLSILLILVGAQLFGIFGMIFAIPMYLVYKIILRESYEELVRIYD